MTNENSFTDVIKVPLSKNISIVEILWPILTSYSFAAFHEILERYFFPDYYFPDYMLFFKFGNLCSTSRIN